MNEASIPFPIPPGDWLGMIGGGQLGRMYCHAAQSLGYKVAVLDPDPDSPAGAVADMHIRAGYDDQAGLRQLSERCKAITTEFENVPAQSLQALAARSAVRPAAQAVAIVQDRIQEKAFIQSAGAPVAPYAAVHTPEDIAAAPDALFPGVLKAARLGYDGKGQARVRTRAEAQLAFAEFGAIPCVLEAFLPLASELSVVMARGADGQAVFYPSARNEHRDGILAVSTVDAQARDQVTAGQAAKAALAIAQRLQYVGVLCVEFFVLRDGSLVANEIAPRPHNSGHYTMDASVSSQFEQQVRVTAGLPLGSTDCLCSVVMLNILGDAWFDPETGARREPDWPAVLAVPGAKLHLYGKAEARRGRKMGHVNVLGATLADAQSAAARVARALAIPFQP
ncbi:5-(carboxyamino)imidazole ribonucleotide synthase [Pollutimonas bauzanensis]|uniref:N5-carboxyaminoimidazole ribonucleotide synthase n=1 Tax=Pollutimonas bauzanensis TaxID=658167 RepID=A0A1M5WYR1_9BURK|nr:5-(carboxyamino)imidazole ribonucleotide synthase [Pollutimonas bauzanensis]SHH92482.1 5-(carboxyamino)imidazole ribonucleotide synthase [Pollutimonas bauzanensis]